MARIRSRQNVSVLIAMQKLKSGCLVRRGEVHARGTAYAFGGAYRDIGQHLWHFFPSYLNIIYCPLKYQALYVRSRFPRLPAQPPVSYFFLIHNLLSDT